MEEKRVNDPAPETAEDGSEDLNRAEQSVNAFREALEASVTISRERLQEVLDDAVQRGRMTRGDAEELLSRLVTRGREQAEDVIGELDRLLKQLRGEVTATVTKPRQTAERAAARTRREFEDAADKAREGVGTRFERGRRRTVSAVDQPLASADRMRRRTRIGFPISAYDQLTIRQIDSRLAELTRDQLRKVRDYEEDHKARKGVLRSIDRKLEA